MKIHKIVRSLTTCFFAACPFLAISLPHCNAAPTKDEVANCSSILVIKENRNPNKAQLRCGPSDYYWREWTEGPETYRSVLNFSKNGEVQELCWHERTTDLSDHTFIAKMFKWWTASDLVLSGKKPLQNTRIAADKANFNINSAQDISFQLSGTDYHGNLDSHGELRLKNRVWHSAAIPPKSKPGPWEY